MDPSANVTSLIHDILQKEQECELEVKRRRHYEDTLEHLNKSIDEYEIKCEKLRNELNINEKQVVDLKSELIQMQIKYEALKKVSNEHRQMYEDGINKLDELRNEIWSNKEEFCEKAAIFVDNYGVVASKNKIVNKTVEKQYLLTELDNKIIQDEFNNDLNMDNFIDREKNDKFIIDASAEQKNDFISELKMQLNNNDSENISKKPAMIHTDASLKFHYASNEKDIDFTKRSLILQPFNIVNKPNEYNKTISNKIKNCRNQLPITNFINLNTKKDNSIMKSNDNQEQLNTPYSVVEILDPCPDYNSEFNIKHTSNNNNTLREGIHNTGKMYREIMLSKKQLRTNKRWSKNKRLNK